MQSWFTKEGLSSIHSYDYSLISFLNDEKVPPDSRAPPFFLFWFDIHIIYFPTEFNIVSGEKKKWSEGEALCTVAYFVFKSRLSIYQQWVQMQICSKSWIVYTYLCVYINKPCALIKQYTKVKWVKSKTFILIHLSQMKTLHLMENMQIRSHEWITQHILSTLISSCMSHFYQGEKQQEILQIRSYFYIPMFLILAHSPNKTI